MSTIDILFSVNEYDRDGEVCEKGIFFHFRDARVRVALDMEEFRALPAKIQSMVDEVAQNYPEFASRDATSLPSGAHPDHLTEGPIRNLYSYLYRERQRCDQGTVMWGRYTDYMDTMLALYARSETKAKMPPEANELAAALRDAARYRFLQRTSCGNATGGKGSDEECYLSLNPRDMDAAIDAHLLDETRR